MPLADTGRGEQIRVAKRGKRRALGNQLLHVDNHRRAIFIPLDFEAIPWPHTHAANLAQGRGGSIIRRDCHGIALGFCLSTHNTQLNARTGSSPGPHRPLRRRWQGASEDHQIYDTEQGFILCMNCMEMRRVMIVGIHLNFDPAGDLGDARHAPS